MAEGSSKDDDKNLVENSDKINPSNDEDERTYYCPNIGVFHNTESCSFSHDISIDALNRIDIRNVVCSFFLSNTCKYEENCYFAHVKNRDEYYDVRSRPDTKAETTESSVSKIEQGTQTTESIFTSSASNGSRTDEHDKFTSPEMDSAETVNGNCPNELISRNSVATQQQTFNNPPSSPIQNGSTPKKNGVAKCHSNNLESDSKSPVNTSANSKSPVSRKRKDSDDDQCCMICFCDPTKDADSMSRNRGYSYGLLQNCDHVCCLNCIRKWRAQARSQPNFDSVEEEVDDEILQAIIDNDDNGMFEAEPVQINRETALSCPICRAASHFVTPSTYKVENTEEKIILTDFYKKVLSKTPCKYFANEGRCPYRNNCFYLHSACYSGMTLHM